MNIETQKQIITEFEKQREIVLNSNATKDDIKIIQNIAKKFKVDFFKVLNVIEFEKNNIQNDINKFPIA